MAFTPREYNTSYSSGSSAAFSSAGASRRKRRRRRSTSVSVLPILLSVAVVLAAAFAGVTLFKHFSGGSPTPKDNMLVINKQENSKEESQSSEDDIIVISSPSEDSESDTNSSVSSASEAFDGIDKTDWRLKLVNSVNKLDGDYEVKLAEVTGGYQMDARMVDDMKAMLAAAKADGYNLQICSAYRSTERSRVLYNNQIAKFKNAGYTNENAAIEAAKWVAPPGTSEHNTGLSADIVSNTYFSRHAELDHVFETYKEFTWLYEHCAEYGFILRFPKDKQEITGITYEPWHYRYVGKENAKKIMDAKICLEEYLGEVPEK